MPAGLHDGGPLYMCIAESASVVSCWPAARTGSSVLLRTKRRDRIDPHRTARRNEARDRNHEQENADDAA